MNDPIPFLDLIHNNFGTVSPNLNQYSPLALAYIGDGVFELIIRTLLVEQENLPVKKLHRQAIQIVKAKTQAELVLSIEETLSPEEHAIYLRGRNAKPSSVAKNADLRDYRNATGFETLVGYLYLSNQLDRAMKLIKLGLINLNIHPTN